MLISSTINHSKLQQATLDRAVALYNEGQFHGAGALLEAIADDTGGTPFVQHMRGLVAAELGQTERAQELLSIAIRLSPTDATAHANLGILLLNNGRYAPAAAAFEAALLLQPTHQNALASVAKCYAELGLFDLAIDAYRDALLGMPDHIALAADLAALLNDSDDTDASLALYQELLAREPDRAELHTALAVNLFTSGDWSDAWREYEWRWRDPRYRHATTIPPAPRWEGQALDGKAILLQAEQGFGDTIQFVRYASHVKALGAHVILQVDKALVPLLRSAAGIDRIVGTHETLPPCDLWAPLMSLPGLLGATPDRVRDLGSYLHADEDLTATWKDRLDRRPGLAVGLVWQGNPTHSCDRWRSMPFGALRPLLACRDIQFVSLQVGAGHEQLSGAGSAMVDPGQKHAISSFADTAAIVANLDLVISIDSSVAHLAGALGKPVWILLAARNDWRWMRQCEHTPWYAQARLFRQQMLGDWDTVVLKLREALCAWAQIEPPTETIAAVEQVPRDLSLHHALFAQGVRRHRDNDALRAKACFSRLLQHDPDHVDALCNLGALESADGAYERALALLQRAVQLSPDLPSARLALADTLSAAGHHDDAITQYRETIRRAPRNAAAHASLALALRAHRDLDTAIKHFELAVQIDQNQPATFYLALGQTLLSQQRLAGAMISLQHALALDPKLAEASDILKLIGSQFSPSSAHTISRD